MNWYVTRMFSSETNVSNAGFKAKDDVNHFLNEVGFKNVDIKTNVNKFDKFFKTSHKLRKQISFGEDGLLVFQYPLSSRYISDKLVKMLKANPNLISVCLVHDLESLRLSAGNKSFKNNEMKFLNKFDYLIVHNQHMKNWLIKNGVKSSMVVLEVFDYYKDYSGKNDFSYNENISYAGNLSKAHFLESIKIKRHKIIVYGLNQSVAYPQNIIYKGSLPPEELPKHLHSKYGLVWDGDSISECSGIYGEYLKYNTPHKISLYISAGIPVIVWKKSAMADFIRNNNLGLCVDKVSDLDNILSKVSDEQYTEIKKNTLAMSKKISEGYFIKRALHRILKDRKISEDFE